MREVFNNAESEEEFRKKGFITFPFLSQDEVAVIKPNLLKLQPSDNYTGSQETYIGKQPYHVTFFDKNADYRHQVYDFVRERFLGIAGQLLKDYKCVQANVFIKPAGTGFVHPHQNITIADENKFTTLSFWLPLQDTTFENGAICLIPGSQAHFVKFRNTHVTWPYLDFFINGKGRDYFVPVNVKAGELLVIDDRIVHYTPVNTSNADRWVLHSLWAPTEAVLRFYDPGKEQVKIYEVDDDFWQFQVPGSLLTNREPSLTIPNGEKKNSETELLNLLEELKTRS